MDPEIIQAIEQAINLHESKYHRLSTNRPKKSQCVGGNIKFNYEDGQFEGITTGKTTKWAAAFPAVNIGLNLKQAALWALDNPTKRKSNWGRFLTNWLKRNQERGGSGNSRKQKLFPIIGKNCGKPGCRLPAVYKDTSGNYDNYCCRVHLPEKVKEVYE